MSDMNIDNLRLSDRLDSFQRNIMAQLDCFEQRLTGKLDSLKDVVTALAINMEKQFGTLRAARAFDRVWYLLMTGGILGIMARAFKWL